MKKNNKNLIILFVGIVILIAICLVYKLYKDTEIKKMKTALSLEYPIIFSADLRNGDKGTYRYYPVDGKMEKISDYIFTYTQYSNDRKKILGFVWEAEYNGLAELDLTDNSIVHIASLDEISTCIQGQGNNPIEFQSIYSATRYIRNPRYFKGWYTFDFGGKIYFLYKEDGNWKAKIIINDEYKIYSYHMDSENQILIEGGYGIGEIYRSKVSICDTSSGKEEILFDNEPVERSDNNGLMDVSKDGKLIAYYEKKHIFVYDRITGKKKYVARPRLCDSYILDLKFSPDNRYIFYTVGEVDFFSSNYMYDFYVVDTESKTKMHLKRWKNYEDFFGFEW